MSRFLILVMILSIVVMAQSVVALTLAPDVSPAVVLLNETTQLGTASIGTVETRPEPLSLFMLTAGLAGLAAAGSRTAPRQPESPEPKSASIQIRSI